VGLVGWAVDFKCHTTLLHARVFFFFLGLYRLGPRSDGSSEQKQARGCSRHSVEADFQYVGSSVGVSTKKYIYVTACLKQTSSSMWGHVCIYIIEHVDLSETHKQVETHPN
jgi:hypothetical protein